MIGEIGGSSLDREIENGKETKTRKFITKGGRFGRYVSSAHRKRAEELKFVGDLLSDCRNWGFLPYIIYSTPSELFSLPRPSSSELPCPSTQAPSHNPPGRPFLYDKLNQPPPKYRPNTLKVIVVETIPLHRTIP